MVDEVIWEDAPTVARGRKSKHAWFFDALRANPGKTARAPENMSLSSQYAINNGKMGGPGFEARTSTVDAEGNALPEGEKRMWVTFVGEKATAKARKGRSDAGKPRGRRGGAE